MTLYVTGIDTAAALDTIYRDKLHKIAEKVLSENTASTTNRCNSNSYSF